MPHVGESRIPEISACGILGSILASHANVLLARQEAKGTRDEALRTSAGRLNDSRSREKKESRKFEFWNPEI